MQNIDMTNAEAVDQLAKALAEKAKELRADARKREQEARRQNAIQARVEHHARMYAEIGQPLAGLNEAQHGIVYSQAWDQGHSSGFGEVESYYGEFAEMARKILAAN